MFVVRNLLNTVAGLTSFVAQTLSLILLINALLSWVRPDPNNPIVMFLERVSDAVCAPIRRVIPTVYGGLDLAPLLAMAVLWFGVNDFLVRTLRDLAGSL